MSTEHLLRITVCITRAAGVSEAEFHTHWAHSHGPLVAAWLRKYGVVKYVQVRHHSGFPILPDWESLLGAGPPDRKAQSADSTITRQYHITPEHKAAAQQLAAQSGRPTVAYDGMADFYVRELADFMKAFEDEHFREVVAPDELRFVDMKSATMVLGREWIVIERGGDVQEHGADGF